MKFPLGFLLACVAVLSGVSLPAQGFGASLDCEAELISSLKGDKRLSDNPVEIPVAPHRIDHPVRRSQAEIEWIKKDFERILNQLSADVDSGKKVEVKAVSALLLGRASAYLEANGIAHRVGVANMSCGPGVFFTNETNSQDPLSRFVRAFKRRFGGAEVGYSPFTLLQTDAAAKYASRVGWQVPGVLYLPDEAILNLTPADPDSVVAHETVHALDDADLWAGKDNLYYTRFESMGRMALPVLSQVYADHQSFSEVRAYFLQLRNLTSPRSADRLWSDDQFEMSVEKQRRWGQGLAKRDALLTSLGLKAMELLQGRLESSDLSEPLKSTFRWLFPGYELQAVRVKFVESVQGEEMPYPSGAVVEFDAGGENKAWIEVRLPKLVSVSPQDRWEMLKQLLRRTEAASRSYEDLFASME